MTSTFLHEDKKVPPDSNAERDAPVCASCGEAMWLTKVTQVQSDSGFKEVRDFECKKCGSNSAALPVAPVVPGAPL
jgi:hypothetical protein